MKDKSISISSYQKTVDKWITTHGVRYFNELTNMAILTEETGEVARLISRLYGEQSFKNPEEEKNAKTKLADELADVMFVITCIANQTGIDLSLAISTNMEKKTQRDFDRHQSNHKLI